MLGAFTWGAGGQATPSDEAMKRRARISEMLLASGLSDKQPQHWSEGIARGLNIFASGYLDKQNRDEQTAGKQALSGDVAAMLGVAAPAQSGILPPIDPQKTNPMLENSGDASKGYDNPASRSLYQAAIGRGYSPVQAAAFVGAGALPESSLNPNARNPGDGRDGTDSIGMFQWNSSRAKDLQKFASDRGAPWNDPKLQAEFALNELEGPEGKAGQALRAAKTPEEATGAMVSYLRPGGYSPGMPQGVPSYGARLNNTTRLHSLFGQDDRAPRQQQPLANVAPQAGNEIGASTGGFQQMPDGSQRQTLADGRVQIKPAGGDWSSPQTSAPVQAAQAGPAPQATPPPAGSISPDRMRSAYNILNSPFAGPADKAVAQTIIQKALTAETKDPRDSLIKDQQVTAGNLSIEEKRRGLGRVDIETKDAPDGTVYEREKGKPGAEWKQSIKLGQKPEASPSDVREYEYYVKQETEAGRSPQPFNEYRLSGKKAGATSITNDITGGSSKQVFDEIKDRATIARSTMTGLTALKEARKAVESGGFFGAGADAKLGFAKIGAALGFEDGRITNTETFRSAIAPQIAAVMKATVGTTNISNSDREFAEKAAGGSIALDQKSITRLLNIMERGSNAIIDEHKSLIDEVYPETPDKKYSRERAMFGIRSPRVDPQNSGQAPPPPSKVLRYNPKTGALE